MRLLLIAALSLAISPASAKDPELDYCLVSLKDEVRVPAEEPGVLVELDAEEGMQVEQDQLLARIDDTERQMQKKLAMIERAAASEEADNDINVRYAQAAARVAKADYDKAVEANRRIPGTIPSSEVRRLQLAWHRADLQIEQSQHEQTLAGYKVQTRTAEVEAAETNIERRRIKAKLGGEVVEVYKHAGEWVSPGDDVLRIVRLDKLRVEGFVNSAKYNPGEVAGRNVTVVIEFARGATEDFTGKITYVSSLVQAGGQYRVWADVENRREGDRWLLRPGQTATMTIHLK